MYFGRERANRFRWRAPALDRSDVSMLFWLGPETGSYEAAGSGGPRPVRDRIHRPVRCRVMRRARTVLAAIAALGLCLTLAPSGRGDAATTRPGTKPALNADQPAHLLVDQQP